jgi:hypothetical protein
MSCSKHGRVSSFTLEETLEHVKQNRQHKKRTIDHLLDEGWINVDPKSNNFTYDIIDKEKAFLMLDFNRRIKKIDLFRTMLTDDLIETIMERINDKMKFGNKTRMKKGLKKIFKFLAVYIRVQALQEKPIETEKKVDPQRKSFQAAMNFFHEKFEEKPPGINFIEKLKAHFHISVKEETLFQKNFLVAIISLGQWVAGDEKLFRFWGNSGWIQICPNKPDHIGIWIYELTAKVFYIIIVFCYVNNIFVSL